VGCIVTMFSSGVGGMVIRGARGGGREGDGFLRLESSVTFFSSENEEERGAVPSLPILFFDLGSVTLEEFLFV
jgi:hypothetical protein